MNTSSLKDYPRISSEPSGLTCTCCYYKAVVVGQAIQVCIFLDFISASSVEKKQLSQSNVRSPSFSTCSTIVLRYYPVFYVYLSRDISVSIWLVVLLFVLNNLCNYWHWSPMNWWLNNYCYKSREQNNRFIKDLDKKTGSVNTPTPGRLDRSSFASGYTIFTRWISASSTTTRKLY